MFLRIKDSQELPFARPEILHSQDDGQQFAASLAARIEKVTSCIQKTEEKLTAAEVSGAADQVRYLQNALVQLLKTEYEMRKQATILLQAAMPGQLQTLLLFKLEQTLECPS